MIEESAVPVVEHITEMGGVRLGVIRSDFEDGSPFQDARWYLVDEDGNRTVDKSFQRVCVSKKGNVFGAVGATWYRLEHGSVGKAYKVKEWPQELSGCKSRTPYKHSERDGPGDRTIRTPQDVARKCRRPSRQRQRPAPSRKRAPARRKSRSSSTPESVLSFLLIGVLPAVGMGVYFLLTAAQYAISGRFVGGAVVFVAGSIIAVIWLGVMGTIWAVSQPDW